MKFTQMDLFSHTEYFAAHLTISQFCGGKEFYHKIPTVATLWWKSCESRVNVKKESGCEQCLCFCYIAMFCCGIGYFPLEDKWKVHKYKLVCVPKYGIEITTWNSISLLFFFPHMNLYLLGVAGWFRKWEGHFWSGIPRFHRSFSNWKWSKKQFKHLDLGLGQLGFFLTVVKKLRIPTVWRSSAPFWCFWTARKVRQVSPEARITTVSCRVMNLGQANRLFVFDTHKFTQEENKHLLRSPTTVWNLSRKRLTAQIDFLITVVIQM